MSADHYSYRVFWSPEDGEFVGVCSELPSLSHLASTQEAALKGIRALAESTVDDLRRAGEPVPTAVTEKTFSGHVQVRLPSNLHRNLVFEAKESQRSLNRVIIDRLVGATAGQWVAVERAHKRKPSRGTDVPTRVSVARDEAKRPAKRRSKVA